MISNPTNGYKQMKHCTALYYQDHILQQQHCLDGHSVSGFPSPLLNPTLSQSDLQHNFNIYTTENYKVPKQNTV